jgi:RES domain-containing protein
VSLEVETALDEVLAYFRRYNLPVSQAMPRIIVSLQPKVQRVLDFTDGAIRRPLAVSERRILTKAWREENKRGREALPQALGRHAYEIELEGLLAPSAARKRGRNLILFPANMDAPGSWLRIINRDELPRGF